MQDRESRPGLPAGSRVLRALFRLLREARVVGGTVLGILALAVALLDTAPLGAQVLISEFLALNGSGIEDEDGDDSDWIELFNAGDEPVDLEGWYLTDRADDLRRWRFPAVGLDPGEHLLVFASGKNRSEPGAPLHASFELDGDGEFLALVHPDGSTVAHAFAPAFASQLPDVSYGLAFASSELVRPETPVDLAVPASGAPAGDWTSPQFVPGAGWILDAALPVGHEISTSEGLPPEVAAALPFDGTLQEAAAARTVTLVGAAAPTFVEGRDGRPDGAILLDGVDDYLALSPGGALPVYGQPEYTVSLWVKGLPQRDRRVYSEGSSTNNSPVFNIGTDSSGQTGRVDIYIRDASGATLHSHTLSSGVAFDGTWHHIAWTDRGGNAALYIDGARDATGFSYSKANLPLDRVAVGAILRAAPSYHFEGAIDDVLVWTRALDAAEVAALAAGASPSSLLGYASVIRTDVGAAMEGAGGAAYLRLGFELPEPDAVQSLLLRVRYDDGFIAYLNGSEVARRNVPIDGGPDALAIARHEGAAALAYEDFPLPAARASLLPGRNVLGIRAVKVAPDDPGFLIDAALRASSVLMGEPLYFKRPTPGEANGQGSLGIVGDTRFSVDRGLHEEPFLVEIATDTPGAEIRYTLDGRAPTEEDGIVYGAPILVERTTVLRAAAFREGFEPTNVDTQTYIFPDDVLRQVAPPGYPARWGGIGADYAMDPSVAGSPALAAAAREGFRSLRTLSIAIDPDDLFGPDGIHQNPTLHGEAWERPASAEIIDPVRGGSIQVDCGLRVYGNTSRNLSTSPKLAFRLLFKRIYGPGKLRHRLFGPDAADEFDTLILRSNWKDSWLSPSEAQRAGAQYIRDAWVLRAHVATGNPAPHDAFVHLYLNGLYWGVFDLTERPHESFAASYFGGEEEDWDVIRNHEEVAAGDRAAYDELVRRSRADLSRPDAYASVLEMLDIDSFIDWLIVNLFAPAVDWPGNYAMVRLREEGARWKFLSWDSDEAFQDGVAVDRTQPHWRDADSPTMFFHPLRANAEFRLRFADRVQKRFFVGGILEAASAAALWEALSEEVEPALLCESARWGDYRRSPRYRPDVEWRAANARLIGEFFALRSGIVLNQFRSGGLYPQVAAPTFDRVAGVVPRGTAIGIEAPAGALLWTIDESGGGDGGDGGTPGGTDPRLEGGAIAPEALIVGEPPGAGERAGAVVEIVRSVTVRARALRAGEWSALSEARFVVDRPLRISEIMYHPPPATGSARPADDFEFVELVNVGEEPLDLAGFRLDGGIGFDFGGDAPLAPLPPLAALVVVSDRVAFASRYGTRGIRVAGEYGGRLSNAGERLRLLDPEGDAILDFLYDELWCPETDGGGHSLEIGDLLAEPAAWGDGTAWRPSAEVLGSPGESGLEDPGGLQIPGDINQDGVLDIADPVGILARLFLGSEAPFPCGPGSGDDGADGNLALLDANGDGRMDLSDAVWTLLYLFLGGPPHILGTECVPIPGCPSACVR